MLRITQKMLIVLTTLKKNGAQYGAKMAELYPDILSDATRVGQARMTNVYVLLQRMEKGGLIEHMKRFAPRHDESSHAAARKWYNITPAGRKVLDDHHKMLEV